jgi:uncharacterized membrane protein YphA (DoxX/SURF4 family)
MFPTGLPGLGLLFLRASVAIAVILEAYGYRQMLSGGVQGLAILVSAALLLGCLTPIAALAGLAFHSLVYFQLIVGDSRIAIVLILDAMALALLGPGAYSIDSRVFGRRVVILSAKP